MSELCSNKSFSSRLPKYLISRKVAILLTTSPLFCNQASSPPHFLGLEVLPVGVHARPTRSPLFCSIARQGLLVSHVRADRARVVVLEPRERRVVARDRDTPKTARTGASKQAVTVARIHGESLAKVDIVTRCWLMVPSGRFVLCPTAWLIELHSEGARSSKSVGRRLKLVLARKIETKPTGLIPMLDIKVENSGQVVGCDGREIGVGIRDLRMVL